MGRWDIMIDRDKVVELAANYGLKCKFYDDGKTCYIHSAKDYDEWMVEILKEDQLVLMHKNRNRRKNWMHEQRHFRDFDFMFKSIRDHDWFKVGNRTFRDTRIGKLLDQVAETDKKKKRARN
jgi:hypothetical protein